MILARLIVLGIPAADKAPGALILTKSDESGDSWLFLGCGKAGKSDKGGDLRKSGDSVTNLDPLRTWDA